ncbi:hypothetical protein L2E82_49223 [Cichorium intybus]|uniref:Uncharacterized protein n=1 Tax=Cichorium intybus TaxID=13427 RepID=A0ACB8Z038_CICIN|nr:hypothetical protein L2E82_49223 [Cichorium intybus]
MTPSRITMVVKTLSDSQKKAVQEMGFGAMLSLQMEYVPGLLNYYILDNYDPQHNMLVLENTLAYVYRLTFSFISLTKLSPFVKHINGDDLERIEKYEVANGGFGKAAEDKTVEDGEDDERTESEDVNTIPTEYIGFENGWRKRMSYSMKKVGKMVGVSEDSTERSPTHGFDSDDDEMSERQLSPITRVISEGRENESKAKEDELPNVAVRNLNDDLMEANQQEVEDKKGKRPVKIPKHLHSPFMQRIVTLDERIMPDELSVCNAIFASQRDYGEIQCLMRMFWKLIEAKILETTYGNKQNDANACMRMRTKYMATLMRSSLNIHRDMFVKDGEAFGKLDLLQKKKLLQQSEEAKKRKRRGNGVQK